MLERRPSRRGFTLIELLVVVAIIALLISILLPSLNQARKQTRATICRSNLHQLALGWHLYAHDFNGFLPGSTWDFAGAGVKKVQRFCWLGTWSGGKQKNAGGDNPEYVPQRGTIFKYVYPGAAFERLPDEPDNEAGNEKFANRIRKQIAV